jgi:hypothetical protein
MLLNKLLNNGGEFEFRPGSQNVRRKLSTCYLTARSVYAAT